MRILIVEDDPGMGVALRAKLDVILQKFPDAEVTLVRSFADAVAKVHTFPFPDVTLLDLTLLDMAWEETVARINEIESHSAVVIVTGHPADKVKTLLVNSEIEVVTKTPEMLAGNFLIAAIARAINRRGEKENKRLKENISVMRELIGLQDATPPLS